MPLYNYNYILKPMKRRGMNKRGQVFLLAAIIFSIAIYSVAIQYNSIIVYPNLEDFEDISENYQNEYPKVYNYAVYKGDNVAEKIDEFSADFVDEARKRDPNFGVFYAFQDVNGNVHIVNTLNDKVLTIKTQDVDGKQVKLTLLPSNTQSTGHICMGSLCGTATADIGGEYYQGDIKNPGNILEVTIIDEDSESGEGLPIKFDISKFSNLIYTSSKEDIDELPEITEGLPQSNVAVSLKQY